MSKIKANSVVGITYILTNSQGEELDRAEKSEPLNYIHGMSQIVPGLEKALEGLEVGAKQVITVSPEEGYGEVNPELKMTLSRKQFPADAQIDPGVQFYASTGGERLLLTVTGVTGEDVEVDGNHPLSGQTLKFDVEIVSIRDATAEELEHGHVHGPGGHDH